MDGLDKRDFARIVIKLSSGRIIHITIVFLGNFY